jgi:hypothetical protein
MSDEYGTQDSDIDVLYVMNRDESDSYKLWGGSDLPDTAAGRVQKLIGREIHLHGKQFSLKGFLDTVDKVRTGEIIGIKSFPDIERAFFGRYEAGITLPMSDISRLLKGDRVNEIRQQMRSAFLTLPDIDRKIALDQIALFLAKEDGKSRWKRLSRLKGAVLPMITRRREAKEWVKTREGLWRARLDHLWNAPTSNLDKMTD